MPNVLNTDPILSVPKCNWCTKRNDCTNRTQNDRERDPSVPKSSLVYTNTLVSVPTGVPNKVYQSETNVPKLTRNDAQCTKHRSYS